MLLKDKANLNLTDKDMRIYSPGYAPIGKIKNKFRMRILLKCKDSDSLTGIMERIYAHYNKNYKTKEISLSIDINPVNML